MSEYVTECMKRALKSAEELKAKGKEPDLLEISSDVWTLINMGGINMFPGEQVFAGFKVVVRSDLENHIEAIESSE